MPDIFEIDVPTEEDMLNLGHCLGAACPFGIIIYLQGALGAGKTTLTRGILRGLGFNGFVKSPSYTLIELYTLSACTVIHLDLYRLMDPEELYHLGLQDYLQDNFICLIEWPEKAESFLPPADVRCEISHHNQHRKIRFTVFSEKTKIWLESVLGK